MLTAELLVPDTFNVEITIEKVRTYTSLSIDQIPAKLFQAGGYTLCSEIYKLNSSIGNKDELQQQWKKSFIVHIYERGNKSD
jgi:hypothetical protein